jgi:PAS domain S-box-containing protein
LFTADAAGRLDFVNERWAELTGVLTNSLLGDAWTACVHPYDQPSVSALWGEHILNREPFDIQFRLLRADGTYRWVEMQAVPELVADGTVVRWFGAGVDIDAQRRALDALEFLAESGATVATASDVETILSRMAEASLAGIADVTIFDLLDDSGDWHRFAVTSAQIPATALRAINSFQAPEKGAAHPIARAMDEGRSVHVPSVDETFIVDHVADPARRDAWRNTGIRSLVAVPLIARAKQMGALTLLRTLSGVPFDVADVRVAEEIGRRAGIAVENVRLNEVATRNARAMEFFARIGEALYESLGLQQTVDAIVRTVVPEYADWAMLDLSDYDNRVRVAAIHHVDSEKARLLQEHIGHMRVPGIDAEPHKFDRNAGPLHYRIESYQAAAEHFGSPLLDTAWRVGVDSLVIVPMLGVPGGGATLTLCMSDATRAFEPAWLQFLAELARRIAPALANARIFERERLVARSFQQAALPDSLPVVDGYAFDAVYEAGSAEALVGGDWYDAFVLVDGRIVVSIGDVAGSGLQAAVTMSNVRQAIRGVAQVHADPDLMLQAADRTLRSENPDRFVTAFVGVIDPISQTITFKSAGHLPALLRLADGSCSELVSRGLPLGLRRDDEPAAQTAELPVGSTLVLYTDGLVESTRDLLVGERRLRVAVADPATSADEHPARALHDALLQDGATDDVAILTVAVRPRKALRNWILDPRDAAGTDAARRAILEELDRHDYPKARQAGAELILAEVIANLKRYAPGDAEMLLEWTGARPVLHVRDRGPGFEFAAKLPRDIYSESGRGLFLISSLALDFQVTRRSEGGSHARIVLNA